MAEEGDVNKFVIWILFRLLSLDFDSFYIGISLLLSHFVPNTINLAIIVREDSVDIFLVLVKFIAWFALVLIAANNLAHVVKKQHCRVSCWLKHKLHLSSRLKSIARNWIVRLLVKDPEQAQRNLFNEAPCGHHGPVASLEFEEQDFVCYEFNHLDGADSLLTNEADFTAAWLRFADKSVTNAIQSCALSRDS